MGRRKKKVRGDQQWDGRVYAGRRTDAGGYLAFFSVAGARFYTFSSKIHLIIFRYHNVKKHILFLIFASLLFTLPLTPANAYMVKYKEDWYKLYHVHY